MMMAFVRSVFVGALTLRRSGLMRYTKWPRDEPGRVTSHPTIPTLRVVLSSTRHNSTTIDPIQEAIKYIKLRKAGDNFLYC